VARESLAIGLGKRDDPPSVTGSELTGPQSWPTGLALAPGQGLDGSAACQPHGLGRARTCLASAPLFPETAEPFYPLVAVPLGEEGTGQLAGVW
jgi:hypothetical protein